MSQGLPSHLLEREHLLQALRRFANGQAALYGAPVWLCGSALLDGNADPRDWDLRVMLTDFDFALRYGKQQLDDAGILAAQIVDQWIAEGVTGDYTALRWRWADDNVKQSKRGCRDTGRLIDFQVYPEKWVDQRYRFQARARLDTREDF